MLKKNEWWWPIALVLCALLVTVLAGCDTHPPINNHVMSPTGEIIKIEKYGKSVKLLIKMDCSEDRDGFYIKLLGHDTCRVGQKLKIQ